MSIESNIEKQVDTWAKVLWEYMHVNHQLQPADVMVVLGNHDIRTADRATEIWHQKLALQIIISGGFGKITKDWPQPEANIFADRLIQAGIPAEALLLETTSTNTGDNFHFTKQLAQDKNIKMNSALIVTTPHMERRAMAVAEKVWPEVSWQVTSIQQSYEEYCATPEIKELMLQLMVGDVQRMWVYADKGWQVPVEVPAEVKEAWTKLVQAGYTREVIP